MDKYVLPKHKGIDSFLHSQIFIGCLCARYTSGAGDTQVNKTNIPASVTPTFRFWEEIGSQIESDMPFEGTGALGRCRAGEKDQEVCGGKP